MSFHPDPEKGPIRKDLKFDAGRFTSKRTKPSRDFPVHHGRQFASEWRSSGTAREEGMRTEEAKAAILPILSAQGKSHLLDSFAKLDVLRQKSVLKEVNAVYKTSEEARKDNFQKAIRLFEQLITGNNK